MFARWTKEILRESELLGHKAPSTAVKKKPRWVFYTVKSTQFSVSTKETLVCCLRQVKS